jgi:hypothetical protein
MSLPAQRGKPATRASSRILDAPPSRGVAPTDCRMSELDKVFDELTQKRAEQDRERRERQKLAVDFLAEFFEEDIKPSRTLKGRGIQAHFADSKLILHRPQSGYYEEPLHIVVGEQGEIDVAGRSLGRYQPADKLPKKRELIGEIISFFDL